MRRDPYSGEVFIFMNRARTRIKLLHWEPGGMVIYSKMLESGTFGRPSSIDADSPAGSLEWRELVLNADDAGLQPEQRTALRKEKSYPVIQAFEKWMQASYPKVSPQSRIGRAISYTYALLPRLSRYVNDGRINIDNNLIENAIIRTQELSVLWQRRTVSRNPEIKSGRTCSGIGSRPHNL